MINRRIFLRNTAAAGAVGTAITAPAVPAVAAEPEMTPHELVAHYVDLLTEAMRTVDDTRTYHVHVNEDFVLIAGHKPEWRGA